MRVLLRIVAIELAVAACAHAQSAPQPTGPSVIAGRLGPRVTPGGRTLATKYCTIDYSPDKEADARRLAWYVDASLDSMLRELSSTRPGLADGLACTVFQVPSPLEGVATEGLALSITPNTGRDIQVYVLAQSSYPPTARSMIGTSKDDDYQFKIVGHELSTVLFERLTRDKGTGWFFHDAPGWFTQGCEEYFGLVHSSGRNRVLLGDYVARVIADPNEVRFEGDTLYVRNNYLGGPVLVAFLYDTYGAQRVHTLFTSQKATFHEALAEAIEPNYRALGAKFSVWLSRRGGPSVAAIPQAPPEPSDSDRARFAPTGSACSQDLHIGIASCPASPPEENRMCRAVCIEAYSRVTSAATASPVKVPTAQDRIRFASVAATCAKLTLVESVARGDLCPQAPGPDAAVCQQICWEAFVVAKTAAVPARSSSVSTASAPALPKPQDPYERALRACIYGVLDRGEPPACRFDRPLDDMDFGQRHCDKRCAAATAGGAIARPPPRDTHQP
jgi:hypothetical protein